MKNKHAPKQSFTSVMKYSYLSYDEKYMKKKNKFGAFNFFLSGFSLTNIQDSQGSRWRETLSL